jgi:hypothetical protein
MTPDDPKFRGFLIQKLRGASRFCEQYNQVLKNANRGRNKYECAECKNIKKKNVC